MARQTRDEYRSAEILRTLKAAASPFRARKAPMAAALAAWALTRTDDDPEMTEGESALSALATIDCNAGIAPAALIYNSRMTAALTAWAREIQEGFELCAERHGGRGILPRDEQGNERLDLFRLVQMSAECIAQDMAQAISSEADATAERRYGPAAA
jgi:hypothetical protein